MKYIRYYNICFINIWQHEKMNKVVISRNFISLDDAPSTIVYDDPDIVDSILSFSNHLPTILRYFSCVARFFTKYRLSFKLSKCESFKSRVEYVGHDFTADGNYPVAFKFYLIQKWPCHPPPHSISLLSLIGLC